MNKMSDVDVAWLVGLLEGESSVGAWRSNQNRGGESNLRKYARVEISSVDFEIIERLCDLTGIGNIHKQISEGTKGSNQACNTWRVGKAEDVLDLLSVVMGYGYFSEHRRIQIEEAIEAASATAARKKSGESFSRKNNVRAMANLRNRK